jgi:hypothetical protein
MKTATDEEHSKVMSALAAVGDPYLPDSIEEHREALYNALYELACQGVIPPEIKLSVEVQREEAGAWAFRFSDDLLAWLSPDRT